MKKYCVLCGELQETCTCTVKNHVSGDEIIKTWTPVSNCSCPACSLARRAKGVIQIEVEYIDD